RRAENSVLVDRLAGDGGKGWQDVGRGADIEHEGADGDVVGEPAVVGDDADGDGAGLAIGGTEIEKAGGAAADVSDIRHGRPERTESAVGGAERDGFRF